MEGYTNFTKVFAKEVKADAFVGPVTGDTAGTHTGNVTGNVTGEISGLAGGVQFYSSAGVTITALTAAIGAPAGFVDGTVVMVKDTDDTNKIKFVIVVGGAFYHSGAYTAAV